MRPCKSEPLIHGALASPSRHVSGLESASACRCSPFDPDELSHLTCPSSNASFVRTHSSRDNHVNGNYFSAASHNWATSLHSLASGDCDHDDHDEDQKYEVLTIEGLRSTFNSCMSCGVSWHENHVSLDCGECDGYSTSRPCPVCDGKCGAIWQRNVQRSHNSHKASWDGQCQLAHCMNATRFRKPLPD